MVGLGGQEILLLLMCGGLPAVIALIAILATRKKPAERDLPDDDFDE